MGAGGRNLVFEVLTDQRLIVSCQTGVVPTDAEWDSWLTATSHLMFKFDGCRLLVLSERGHPTAAQVERLRVTGQRIRASGRGYPPTAIISPSSAMRLFVNSLAFVNPSIHCFTMEDRENAFDHIKLSRDEREQAIEAIARLHLQLEVRHGDRG